MEAYHAVDLVRETIRRTRIAIADSHASIERADNRVGNSLRLLLRWRHRFDIAAPILSDEELAQALERWQAAIEQHQVRLEMQRTRAELEPLPPPRFLREES